MIDGYWSDGAADVTVSATLRNDGDLQVGAPQTIAATCTTATGTVEGCDQEITLTLPDGHSPTATNFTIRVPMGVTTVMFGYGDGKSLTLDVEVPERILWGRPRPMGLLQRQAARRRQHRRGNLRWLRRVGQRRPSRSGSMTSPSRSGQLATRTTSQS